MRVHLDTDFAGDPDDACALAMLLGSTGVEVVGITTSLEHEGFRAGCVAHLLSVAGHHQIPVAAGAELTLTGGRYRPTHDDPRHWPTSIAARPATPGAFLDLLAESIAADAVVIAIGGFTNLALLELARPGTLADATVVAMNGWFEAATPGLPQWGPEMDFNTQVDIRAAEIVAASTSLTLVPLTVAMRATLKGSQLERQRRGGPIGKLLADQSQAHGIDSGFPELAAGHPDLPDDLVNFHWDPVTAAVAIGTADVHTEMRTLTTEVHDGVLRFVPDPAGRPHHVVTAFDPTGFDDFFLRSVENLDARALLAR